jgi:hypothetical protein
VREYKHSVSVILAENINRFNRNDITKQQLLDLVASLEEVSVDEKQREFFEAFRNLVDKVENSMSQDR